MAKRSALVTGAHGFLGRHVARTLAAEGYAVEGFGHGVWDHEQWERHGLSSFRAGDVALETLLAGAAPELIIHCAGGASVARSVDEPLVDFRRTVESTAAVLEFARRRAPPAVVVLLSSGSVYGSHEHGTVPEGAPLSPQSPYAAHKLMAETLCASFGRSFGLRSAVVRLFSVYGPGLRKQLLWDACTRLARGDRSFAGTGDETRDFLHVDDAAELILRAVDHASAECAVVNGGAGVGTTVREVVTELASTLGLHSPPSFTQERRPGDPFRFVADIALARSWGWTPRIHWQAGVRAYAAWFAAGAP